MVEYKALLEIFLLPVIVLALWSFLFNSKNSRFTKIFVEGGYMLLAIPMLVLTFVMVPYSLFAFWMNNAGKGYEVTLLFGSATIALIVIVEYFYIKRIVKEIEEKEHKSIFQVIKSSFDPKQRKKNLDMKTQRSEETVNYFDEIEKLNVEKRKIDLEKKEKLKRALLNEYE